MLSLLALAGLPGGALERFALGARQPSQRERDAIHDALTSLPARGRAPRRVYAVDAPDLNAFVIGDVLYIHRPLTQDHHLAAVIAHELAHLGTDGRLTLALRRFCLPLGRPPGVLAGGLSQRLLAQPWLAWWRHREHRADQHAAALGLGDELADLLERTQLLDAAAPFMRDRTHPYTEHRIERLRAAGAAIDRGEPRRRKAVASLSLSDDELRRLAHELAPLLAAAMPARDDAPSRMDGRQSRRRLRRLHRQRAPQSDGRARSRVPAGHAWRQGLVSRRMARPLAWPLTFLGDRERTMHPRKFPEDARYASGSIAKRPGDAPTSRGMAHGEHAP